MDFVGYVQQSEIIYGAILVVDTSGTPTQADELPTWRSYGPSGFLENGTCSKLDTGNITGATYDTPIVITSASHGLTTGTYIKIQDVEGNTNANGLHIITKLTDDTFSLQTVAGVDVAGNDTYVSDTGTWEVVGLYRWSIDAESADGYAVDSLYQVVFEYNLSDVATGQSQSFFVV